MGTMYANRRALQVAADSAALAAANEMRNQLLDPTAPAGTYNPSAKALDFARRNGVTSAGPACPSDYRSTVSGNSSPGLHTWQVQTSKLVPLTFASALGIPAQCVSASAQSIADLKMMDIMLSLDTTYSMELSGTNDIPALQQAVVDFVHELNPSSTNPNSPKVGIARFAGIKCNWTHNAQTNKWDSGTCADDKNVLSDLTFDQNALVKIANNSGTGACPADPTYGCPLRHAPWMGISDGTKLPNAISVVNNTSSGYYAWNNAHGGRNNANGEGTAKKILVIMTDGFNEDFQFAPWNPPANESNANYNSQMQSFGDALKRGPDGQAGTSDDVEIYTVGFFCTPYSTDTTSKPARWCKSTLADQTPHACPGATSWPPAGVTPTDIDNRLRDWSSSTPGTCDHYLPLSKRESLPALFKTLAGRLMRVRLTQ
jgi:hypothetical protein